MTEDKKLTYYKYCLVPCCTNTTCTSIEKVFFTVPKDPVKRKAWTRAMKRDEKKNPKLSNKSSLWCCEDHFSLKEDMENYWHWKLTKDVQRLRLKADVVPHIFDCQKINMGSLIGRKAAKRKHMDLLEQIQVSQIPTPANTHAPSDLPASQNWPGKYRFKVSFRPQKKFSRSGDSWKYSKMMDKLYIKKDALCPINFSANGVLPNDVTIRAMALYSSPGQISKVVHCCVKHSKEELNKGISEAEHLVRCESNMASYQVDPVTKRLSVIVPFQNPPAGQKLSTYFYKFSCFGSCAGGPNRRPLMVVFTLEKDNQEIGRRKLDVKICYSPGRLRKWEETHLAVKKGPVSKKRKKRTNFVQLSHTLEFTKSVAYPAKKAKVVPNNDGKFTVMVDNLACYEFLKQMMKFYEICKVMKNLSPATKRALIHSQRKKEQEERG